MDGNQVYEMIREIANTSDSELEEIFGTYELDLIILNNSLDEMKNKWNQRYHKRLTRWRQNMNKENNGCLMEN